MQLNPKTVAIVGGLSPASCSALFGAHSPVRLELRRCGLEHRIPQPPATYLDGTLMPAVRRARVVAARAAGARRMAERVGESGGGANDAAA